MLLRLLVLLSFRIRIVIYSVSENLESRSHKLLASWASGTLPTIGSNFHCTILSRAKNISWVAILFINPFFSLYKEWTTFVTLLSNWKIRECLAKYLVAIDWKLLLIVLIWRFPSLSVWIYSSQICTSTMICYIVWGKQLHFT